MAAEKLTADELAGHLEHLEGWKTAGDAITKTYQFADFVGSMEFVNALAEAAQSVNHHPDIDIRFSKVTVTLSTHDSGGVTNLDAQMAGTADSLAGAGRSG